MIKGPRPSLGKHVAPCNDDEAKGWTYNLRWRSLVVHQCVENVRELLGKLFSLRLEGPVEFERSL